MLVLAHTLGSAFNVGISSRGVAARAAVSMSTLMDFSANKIDGSKVGLLLLYHLPHGLPAHPPG